MANFNKVILLGNITRDPVLSFLPSHTAVVEFGMAMNRKYKKQDGSQGEEVCFVDLMMYGKRAEVISKYVHKGDQLLVEGRLKLDQWQDKEGNKRSRLRVMIENFEFMGGGKTQGGMDGKQKEQYDNSGGENKDWVGDNPETPEDNIPF